MNTRLMVTLMIASLFPACQQGTSRENHSTGDPSGTPGGSAIIEVPKPIANKLLTAGKARYLVELDCCWSISIFSLEEPFRILEFRFDVLGFEMPDKKIRSSSQALEVADANKDGNPEVYWSWFTDKSVESGAVLIDVVSSSLFRLDYRGSQGLILSTNLQGDESAAYRTWLVQHWREREMDSINLPDQLPIKYADLAK